MAQMGLLVQSSIFQGSARPRPCCPAPRAQSTDAAPGARCMVSTDACPGCLARAGRPCVPARQVKQTWPLPAPLPPSPRILAAPTRP
eukprot:1137696-Pelagomonas_calceolata.AAC.4